MNALMIYELSVMPKPDTFYELLEHASDVHALPDADGEYIDTSSIEKGMAVRYCDGRIKKIGTLFNVPYSTDEPADPQETLQSMEKRIRKYVSKEFRLGDFQLSRLIIATDLKLDKENRAEDYMAVLRRVGNVKGYTLHSERKSGKCACHHWQGNSNNTNVILRCPKEHTHLNLAVQMLKSSAVRAYTQESEAPAQIIKSLTSLEGSLVTLLSNVIPFGRFLKKADAIEQIRSQIPDDTLRRKMIRILEMIPEKKSLKKTMKVSGYRNPKDILLSFAHIDLSPVTISKRMSVRKLENLYMYL